MRSQIDTSARSARFEFDSLADMFRYLDSAPVTWGTLKTSESTHGYYASKGWALGADFPTAMSLARDGWLEGARRAQEALEVFTPRDPAPDSVTDFYGHMPHVPRYCAGAPDSMIRHSPRATMGGGRIVTLYVPVFLSAGVKAECASNYGLGLAQYVNQLEQQGIRVEVSTLYVQSDCGRWKLSYVTRIKYADQPLDLATLCFAIGHPAYPRRLGFALLERSPARADTSYGFPALPSLADIMDPPSGAYILDGMNNANSTARTPQEALVNIGAEIEKAMARIEEDL